MPLVCTKCAKNSDLRNFIQSEGYDGSCDICGEDGRVVDSGTNRFFQLCKALIRFHFNEWDYNRHWGGDDVETLFHGRDNIFFNEERAKHPEAYEELVIDATLQGNVYEEYDKGISLYAGYTDGHPNMLLQSIRSTMAPEVIDISMRLEVENHFSVEEDLKTILRRFQDVASTTMKKGETLFRARVGFESRKSPLGGVFERRYHYTPHTKSEIGAPPPTISSAGRANRAGVSFLYCATNESTAIAEIRPHPGDRVSTGSFRTKRDLKAYDLSCSQLRHYFQSDKDLDGYVPFNTLSILMNRTITPSQRVQYLITQLIADCIRQLGFDAVLFESTVGSGINTVLFNAGDAILIEDGGKVHLIEEVEYRFRSEPPVDPDESYAEDLIRKNGEN